MADFTPLGTDEVAIETLAERVWFAWHCLPRTKDGSPPSWRRLEIDHQLPNGVFSKILAGSRHSVEAPTYRKLARALEVPVLWLLSGEDPPVRKTTGPFEPLGNDKRDPRDHAARVRAYLRRCGFEEPRVERAMGALLATEDEVWGPSGGLIESVSRDLAGVKDVRADEEALRDIALDTLRALSIGKGPDAHRAAQKLARRVLSTGLARDAVHVLTGAPTWGAAALRLAESALRLGDRSPAPKDDER